LKSPGHLSLAPQVNLQGNGEEVGVFSHLRFNCSHWQAVYSRKVQVSKYNKYNFNIHSKSPLSLQKKWEKPHEHKHFQIPSRYLPRRRRSPRHRSRREAYRRSSIPRSWQRISLVPPALGPRAAHLTVEEMPCCS